MEIIPKLQKGNAIRKKDKTIANSPNYGWDDQNNLSERQRKQHNINPAGNFYNPVDWISNGWRNLTNSGRNIEDKSIPHEEALFSRYLGGKRDMTQLPLTPIRFSRDYKMTGEPVNTKEYTGLPKEQKDAIRNHVVPNMKSKLESGKWVQVNDNIRRSRDQRGTAALSGLGKFGLRNNNDSGIYDVVDTYDFPKWVPIPDRNKGYELEIRDTIWTKDVKPELYKQEKGYLPYNAHPIIKNQYHSLIKQLGL